MFWPPLSVPTDVGELLRDGLHEIGDPADLLLQVLDAARLARIVSISSPSFFVGSSVPGGEDDDVLAEERRALDRRGARSSRGRCPRSRECRCARGPFSRRDLLDGADGDAGDGHARVVGDAGRVLDVGVDDVAAAAADFLADRPVDDDPGHRRAHEEQAYLGRLRHLRHRARLR